MCTRRFYLVSFPLLLVLVGGCDSGERAQRNNRQTHEDLDAALWMQTSAEYQAVCRQAYHVATERMLEGIQDPTWSALPNQQDELSPLLPGAKPLPPAVIVDVDETVLDNSPYQARRIEANGGYDLEAWHAWVKEAKAEAVPGVMGFLAAARDAGVVVFYVTNRENAVEGATRKNLETLGFLDPTDPDVILSKHEREYWGSNKKPRRDFIAEHYRVLLLVGDDLNDFVDVGHKPAASERRELAESHLAMWGQKWFLLPNANYGGWERSLYGWDDGAADDAKLQEKYAALNTAESVEIVDDQDSQPGEQTAAGSEQTVSTQ